MRKMAGSEILRRLVSSNKSVRHGRARFNWFRKGIPWVSMRSVKSLTSSAPHWLRAVGPLTHRPLANISLSGARRAPGPRRAFASLSWSAHAGETTDNAQQDAYRRLPTRRKRGLSSFAATEFEEFDFESQDKKQLRGNIYLARVTRVEPSLQAAFVEYGGNRHGFLAFSEIHPDYYQIPVADRQELLRVEAERGRRGGR